MKREIENLQGNERNLLSLRQQNEIFIDDLQKKLDST